MFYICLPLFCPVTPRDIVNVVQLEPSISKNGRFWALSMEVEFKACQYEGHNQQANRSKTLDLDICIVNGCRASCNKIEFSAACVTTTPCRPAHEVHQRFMRLASLPWEKPISFSFQKEHKHSSPTRRPLDISLKYSWPYLRLVNVEEGST